MKYNKWLVKGLHRLTQFGQQMAKLYGKSSTRLATVTADSTDVSQTLAEMEVLDLWYTDGTPKSLVNTLSIKADLVGGLVPANQLPSYVDDVLEYANFAAFPVSGETGKIYYAVDTGSSYRWTGSAYYETNSAQEFYLRTSVTNGNGPALTAVDTAQNSFIRFSSATTLHSLLGISTANLNKLVIITNTNTLDLLIKNESTSEGTVTNRILTGSGKDLKLKPNASILLIYDYAGLRWKVIGGTGSGSGGADGLVYSPSVSTANLKDGQYNDWTLLLVDIVDFPIKKIIFTESCSIPYGNYYKYHFVGNRFNTTNFQIAAPYITFTGSAVNDFLPSIVENIDLDIASTTSADMSGTQYQFIDSSIYTTTGSDTNHIRFTSSASSITFSFKNSILYNNGGNYEVFRSTSNVTFLAGFHGGCNIQDRFLSNWLALNLTLYPDAYDTYRPNERTFPIIGSVTKNSLSGDPSISYSTSAPLEQIRSLTLVNKGDLITKKSSTERDYVSLPVGANGKILTTDSTTESGLKWGDPSSGVSLSFTSASNFPLGSPVYFDGTNWNLAVASNETTSVQYVIISKSGSGPYSYTGTSAGEITFLAAEWELITGEVAGLTSGATYYLSASTAGQIRKTPSILYAPVLRALSTTKAFISLSINNTESGMGDTFYRDTIVTVGDTTDITLTYAPSGKSYVWLSLDGVFQSGTAFDLAGQTITFGSTIPSGVTIDVIYARAVLLGDVGAINRMVSFTETVSGSPKTVFNLPSVPSGAGSCIAFVGGSIQDDTKWNLNGNVLTFTDPVPVGVQVVVYVLNSSGVTQIDSYVTRSQHTISTDGTITFDDVFGSTVSARYRFHELTDPLLEGKILLKYNGIGVDPDVRVVTESSDVTTTMDTASKLNMYITGNIFTIQNKFGISKTLVFFREI